MTARRVFALLGALAAAAAISVPPRTAASRGPRPAPVPPAASVARAAAEPAARDAPAAAPRSAAARDSRDGSPAPLADPEPPGEIEPKTVSRAVGVTVRIEPAAPLTYAFALGQNYPNPFGRTTTIWYSVGRTAHVSIEVFSVTGQRVAGLVDRSREPGRYLFQWDGRGDGGRRLAPGLYLYRMVAGPYVRSRKLVVR